MLHEISAALCRFLRTIFRSIPNWDGEYYFLKTIGLNIIAFGLYEIGIIKTATLTYDRMIDSLLEPNR